MHDNISGSDMYGMKKKFCIHGVVYHGGCLLHVLLSEFETMLS